MTTITTKVLRAPKSDDKAKGTFYFRAPYPRDAGDTTLVEIPSSVQLVDGTMPPTDFPPGPYEVKRDINGLDMDARVAWTPFVVPATGSNIDLYTLIADDTEYPLPAIGQAQQYALEAAQSRDAAAASAASVPADITAQLVDRYTKGQSDTRYAPTSHTHPPTAITDLAEYIQDTVAGLLKAGANVTTTYDDAANTFTINATGGGGSGTDAELVRDTIGGALVAGSGITVNVDDPGDTITITVAGVPQSAVTGLTAALTDRPTKAVADATYAPGSKPLREYYNLRNGSNQPIPGIFTSVKVSSDTPTFTNPTTYSVADLPSCVTFLGGPARIVYGSWWVNDLAKTEAAGTITLSFFTDNQHFVLEGVSYGSGDVKVYADDIPYSSTAIVHSLTYQGPVRVEVTMPTKRMRRFDITVGTAALVKMIGEKNCTFTPAPRPRVRATVIGDSWMSGATKAAGPVSGNALPEYLRLASGVDVCVVAQGGTGYVRPGDSGSGFEPFGGDTRMAGVVRTDPDIVIVAGTVNDYAATQSAIQDAATALYAALATQLPGVPVIVVGAQPVGAADPSYDKCNTAVIAAATAAPNVVGVIDWRGEKWLTGTGKVGSIVGDGNSDYFLSADGLHPEQVGDEYLGHRLASALGAIRVSLKPRTKGVGSGSGLNIAIGALAEAVSRRVRTVNGTEPDATGNVTVAGGGAATTKRPLSSTMVRSEQRIYGDLTSYTADATAPSGVQVAYNATNAGKFLVNCTLRDGGGLWLPQYNGSTKGLGVSPAGFTVEVVHSGTAFAFILYSGPSHQVFVDDQPVTAAPQANVANGYTYTKLVFPTARARRIRIQCGSGTLFGGGYTAVANTFHAPPTRKYRTALIGDSWVQQGIAENLAMVTGWDVYNLGQGSTGSVADGGGTSGSLGHSPYGSTERMAALAALPALDMIGVWGSVNDTASTPAAVVAAATAHWNAIQAARPTTPLVVFGHEPARGGTAADNINAALKTAAATAKLPFIDIRAAGILTGTGKVTAKTGDGTCDYFMSSDDLHPTPEGYLYIAREVAAMLGPVLV